MASIGRIASQQAVVDPGICAEGRLHARGSGAEGDETRTSKAKAHLTLEKSTRPHLRLKTYQQIADYTADERTDVPTFVRPGDRKMWRAEVELLFAEMACYFDVLPHVKKCHAEGTSL